MKLTSHYKTELRNSFPLNSISRETKMTRLILFPLPFHGHINPMLDLAQILFSRGFSVTILHTLYNSDLLRPSNHPDFTFLAVDDGLTAEIPGVVELINLLNTRCVEPLRKRVAELVADGGGGGVGCLITDAHWHFSQGVADEFGIRRIVVRTGNISAFLAMVALPDLRQTSLFTSTETSLEDPVPNLPHLKVKDLLTMKAQSSEVIDQCLSSIFIQTKASSALIFNSFDELEPEPLSRSRQIFSPIPIFPLGPFHKHLPRIRTPELHSASLSWLDTNPPKSVLYVSFGTIAAVDRHEFLEIAWGLANSSHKYNHRFLWVVRPDIVRGDSSLPDGFEEMVGERGLIVKWAPQREVLAHPAIGGFWTHSGWNSTIESICEGVPMLCYPCFGDQNANARYVADVWGIGVLLGDKLERGEIEKGIRELMAAEKKGNGEIMKRRIKDLKEKVDCCVEEGGSTFQSLEHLVNFILNHNHNKLLEDIAIDKK